jgi:hypothetical protein
MVSGNVPEDVAELLAEETIHQFYHKPWNASVFQDLAQGKITR